MPGHRLSAAAGDDIAAIVLRAEAHFGTAAGRRYQALLRVAIGDVAAEPARPGSIARTDLGASIRSYHLRYSRERARVPEGIVGIGRVLHDAMDAKRHLPQDYGGS